MFMRFFVKNLLLRGPTVKISKIIVFSQLVGIDYQAFLCGYIRHSFVVHPDVKYEILDLYS